MRRRFALVCLLAAVPAVAYIPQQTDIDGTRYPFKWSSTSFPIEWRMNPVVGSNVTGLREQAEVFMEAFQEWQGVSMATVSFEQAAAPPGSIKPALDGMNLITTNVTLDDFTYGALAVTLAYAFEQVGPVGDGRTVEFLGQILEADIMFNPDREFSTSETTPSDRFDLQSVATHEIGHLLGLDHSNLLSSTMFPTVLAGISFPRGLQFDDRAGVSSIYPAASFASSGAISGTVRTTAGVPVFGALVVVIDPTGQAAASGVTDPNGQYLIQGLSAGAYTVYAEPMNQPFQPANAFTLSEAYPGSTVNSNFTVRYR